MAKRADIKLGYSCNNNCRHCVVADRRQLGDKSFLQLKEDLLQAKENGVNEVTLTGGEPTIRPDILEIIKFAKFLNFDLIQLQTNGRMFYYKDFTKKMIEAGANEFVVAIHGHTKELQDYITRSPRSFEQTVQGIKNLKEWNAYVYSNTVISKFNYRLLFELTEFLIKLGVDHIQFVFPHPRGNAYRYYEDVIPSISETAPFVHKAIDFAKENNIFVTVEAIPFCLMQGYEKHILEPYLPSIELRDLNRFSPRFEEIRRTMGKIKGPQCRWCRYNLTCEGVWREYGERNGFDELKPVESQPKFT